MELDGKYLIKNRSNPLYKIYCGMRSRCYYESDANFKLYGGRGIKICDRWLNSFETFVKDMISGYTEGLTIDRIKTMGNYEPSNCRWYTRKQQARNREGNFNITYKNQTKTSGEWAEILGISRQSVEYRVKKWGIEKAITTPRSLIRQFPKK